MCLLSFLQTNEIKITAQAKLLITVQMDFVFDIKFSLQPMITEIQLSRLNRVLTERT
jgi:hypothetical protein